MKGKGSSVRYLLMIWTMAVLVSGFAEAAHSLAPNLHEMALAMAFDGGPAQTTQQKWTVTHVLPHDSGVSVVAASPNGQEVASGSILSEAIKIWDVRKGTLIRVLKGLKGSAQSLEYSPDGRFLAVGRGMVKSSETSVHVFQVGSDSVVQRLEPPGIVTRNAPKGVGAVKSLQFSSDGQFLAVGFEGGAIGMYETATGHLKQSFPTSAAIDGPLAQSPSGKYLAISERIKTEADVFDHHVIQLIDVSTGEIAKTFSGHTDLVTSLAFSPDGEYLASGSNTGVVRGGLDKKRNQGVVQRNEDPIRIWNVESGVIAKELVGHTGAVRSLKFFDGGRFLISGSHDKTIKIWNVGRGVLDATLTGHHDLIDSVTITTQGKYLVSGGGASLTIWERHQ